MKSKHCKDMQNIQMSKRCWLVVIVFTCCLNLAKSQQCYREDGEGNLALGKTASHYGQHVNYYPSYALNGKWLNAMYGPSCTHSSPRTNPWMVIDLGQKFDVSTVVLVNPRYVWGDFAQNIYTLVGQTFDGSFTSNEPGFDLCVYDDDIMRKEVRYLQCTRTLHGQFVAIYYQRYTYTGLCEVEVYSEQVFHAEPWTCIWPELVGSAGTENVAKGKQAYLSSVAGGYVASKAVDGDSRNDIAFCARNIVGVDQWIVIDLGVVVTVIGIAVTNSETYDDRLDDFTIWVGNIDGPSTPFDASLYSLCVHMCSRQSNNRRYYSCNSPLKGKHVAIHLDNTQFVFWCEVEVYTTTLFDQPFLTGEPDFKGSRLDKKLLFDNDDDTCIDLKDHAYYRSHLTFSMAWHTGSFDATTAGASTRFCHAQFYANITHGSAFRSIAAIGEYQEEFPHKSSVPKLSKLCEKMGSWIDLKGLMHTRYSCHCPSPATECNVYLGVYLTNNNGSMLLCGLYLYD